MPSKFEKICAFHHLWSLDLIHTKKDFNNDQFLYFFPLLFRRFPLNKFSQIGSHEIGPSASRKSGWDPRQEASTWGKRPLKGKTAPPLLPKLKIGPHKRVKMKSSRTRGLVIYIIRMHTQQGCARSLIADVSLTHLTSAAPHLSEWRRIKSEIFLRACLNSRTRVEFQRRAASVTGCLRRIKKPERSEGPSERARLTPARNFFSHISWLFRSRRCRSVGRSLGQMMSHQLSFLCVPALWSPRALSGGGFNPLCVHRVAARIHA